MGLSGFGQFSQPLAIEIDSSGNVYVAYILTNKIQKFTPTGTFITSWGKLGFGPGSFTTLGAIATDSSGNVYVADIGRGNNGVQKFTNNGILSLHGELVD